MILTAAYASEPSGKPVTVTKTRRIPDFISDLCWQRGLGSCISTKLPDSDTKWLRPTSKNNPWAQKQDQLCILSKAFGAACVSLFPPCPPQGGLAHIHPVRGRGSPTPHHASSIPVERPAEWARVRRAERTEQTSPSVTSQRSPGMASGWLPAQKKKKKKETLEMRYHCLLHFIPWISL